jgi:hypothetical protein
MKTLKLHEIIETNDKPENSLLIESLIPYKKSLYIYYKDNLCSDPVLMVTSVCNAVQYGKIVSSNDFTEEVINWIDDPDCMSEDNENFAEYETICFNSIMLENL